MKIVTYSRKAKVPCHSLQHVLWIEPTVLVTRFALKGEQAEVLRRFQLHAGVRSFDGTTHEGFELKVLRPCSLARQGERESLLQEVVLQSFLCRDSLDLGVFAL